MELFTDVPIAWIAFRSPLWTAKEDGLLRDSTWLDVCSSDWDREFLWCIKLRKLCPRIVESELDEVPTSHDSVLER